MFGACKSWVFSEDKGVFASQKFADDSVVVKEEPEHTEYVGGCVCGVVTGVSYRPVVYLDGVDMRGVVGRKGCDLVWSSRTMLDGVVESRVGEERSGNG